MDRKKDKLISANMTILDIVSINPETEAVFRTYDEQVGECICCQSLFETAQQVTEKHKLDLAELLAKLNATMTD